MSKPFAWSFSGLSLYQTCPLKYYSLKVAKNVIDETTEAIDWGNRVHKALENSINGIVPGEEFAQFEKVLEQLRKIPGNMQAEVKLAVNNKLQPVAFDTPEAWCRAISDVLIINGNEACVFDWKTGKVKEGFDQLHINALLIFATYPEVEIVRGAYIWLKFKQLTKTSFNRSTTKWDRFIASTKFMENSFEHNFWPARKNGLCRAYCPVNTCKYNGQYRGN